MIQSVDQKCDIFAHITVDIVRFRQKIRRLVDQVGCQDTVDDTILVRLIKLIHTVREQTECSGSEDTFRFALFQLFGNIKDTFSGRDHIVDDDHIFSIYGSSEEFVGNDRVSSVDDACVITTFVEHTHIQSEDVCQVDRTRGRPSSGLITIMCSLSN